MSWLDSQPPEVEERLESFVRELITWGSRTNLVADPSYEGVLVHVRDSLAAAPHLPPGARVVDLGSGAGFPGVPIALARPDLRVTLVEGRGKKVSFLRHLARQLPLECQILHGRIERPPEEQVFDVALLRAVAPLLRSRSFGSDWVAEGEVWVWTGPGIASPPGGGVIGTVPLGKRGRILRFPVPR